MKIRAGIFETNSSSTHSCVIDSNSRLYGTLPLRSDGQVEIHYGEFGWEYETYTSIGVRASYALTLIGSVYIPEGKTVAMFYDLFREVIMEQTGATNVLLIENLFEFYPQGYVDHQSVDDMMTEIYASKQSLRDFIFGQGSSLTTDNDNH